MKRLTSDKGTMRRTDRKKDSGWQKSDRGMEKIKHALSLYKLSGGMEKVKTAPGKKTNKVFT